MNGTILSRHESGTRPPDRHGERGSALVLAVFVIVLLTVSGILLLSVSRNEMKMGKATLDMSSVYYVAEAGVEDARALLIANGTDLTTALATAAGPNGVIDFDAQSVQPVFDDQGNFLTFSGTGDDVPLRTERAFGDGRYVVFLTNDPGDADPVVDTNERVMVSSVAVGQGQAFEIVQALMSPVGLLPTPPPCALTLLGPDPLFVAGTAECTLVDPLDPSAGYDDEDKDFRGEDCNGTGVPNLHVPTVCVGGFADYVGDDGESYDDEGQDEFDDTDYSTLGVLAKGLVADEVVDDACPDNFRSGTTYGVDTVANLDDWANEPLLGPDFEFDPTWTDCFELRRVIDDVTANADFVCTRADCEINKNDHWVGGTAPTMAAGTVIVANGNLKFPNDFTGAGLLVVNGKLEVPTSSGWNGTILVVGKGELRRTGADGLGQFYGATVVANIAGVDTIYGTLDDCLGGVNGFSRPIYLETGTEQGDSTYCTTEIAASNPVKGYKTKNK